MNRERKIAITDVLFARDWDGEEISFDVKTETIREQYADGSWSAPATGSRSFWRKGMQFFMTPDEKSLTRNGEEYPILRYASQQKG